MRIARALATVVTATVIASLAFGASPAFADAYGKLASNWGFTAGPYYGHGAQVDSYVQARPAMTYPNGDHVNSMYVRDTTASNFIEWGWYWQRNPLEGPEAFSVADVNGQVTAYYELFNIRQATWSTFKTVKSGDVWDLYLDGTSREEWSNVPLDQTIAAVGAERNYNNDYDDGTGSWHQLKYLDGSWIYWSGVTDTTYYYAASQEDPGYKVSTGTNHDVYVIPR